MKTPKERYEAGLKVIGKLTTKDIKPDTMPVVLHALAVASGLRDHEI